jgi:hypothetical protein
VAENKSITVTDEMIKAGVPQALYQTIPMDVANPVLPDEQIMENIYMVMCRV